jgi:biopolymer transport protein ExbB/TolQ
MVAFFISELGSHTILVLLLLGGGLAAALAIALFHIYRYNGDRTFPIKFIWSENRSLQKVKEKVATEKILLATDEVFDSDVLERIKTAADKRSLIFDRLNTIINLQKSYSRITLDGLQSATETKESASRTLEIPGYFVGFAMLIGLLGTIVGLSVMIGNMQETLNLPQQSTIEFVYANRAKVQQVLGSMQSAFWATIGGLFCSITSSLFNYFMHVSQARFHEKLDTFTVEELLPLVYRSKETSALLKDANTNIEKTFSKLENISQNIIDSTRKLNAVHESFNTIIANLERITQNPLRNEMQQIFQQLSLALAETVKTNQSVQNTVQYIPQVIELMEKNNQQNLNILNHALQENPKHREKSLNNIFAATGKTEPLKDWKSQIQNSAQSDNKELRKTSALKANGTPMTVIISASVLGGIVVLFFIMWLLNG